MANALPKSTPGALTGVPPRSLTVDISAATCSFSLSRISVASDLTSPDRPFVRLSACVVEGGLEVLEREREVQDLDVAAALLSHRLAHEGPTAPRP